MFQISTLLFFLLSSVIATVSVEGFRTSSWNLVAFVTTPPNTRRSTPRCIQNDAPLLFSSAPSDVEPPQQDNAVLSFVKSGIVVEARDELVQIATSLASNSPTGLFLTLPSDRSKFMRAVARLEALAVPDSSSRFESDCIGDWTLVATSRKDLLLDPLLTSISSAAGDDNSSFPSSLRKLDPKIRNSLRVTQRIRSTREEAPDTVDRIDNVIEFDNARTKLLPDFLNPLQIDKSKLVLIHKARVESSAPVFRIRLALQSIVLNLAGQSRNLDPMGKDVLGLNVNLPFLNEWMVNSGEFETTYVDREVRVSRGTIGFLEETRVFIRQGGAFDANSSMNATAVSQVGGMEQEEEPSPLGNIMEAVEEVADAVGNLTKSVKTAVERDAEYMKEDMETSLEDIKNVVQEDLKGVRKAVDKVKSAVLGDEKVEEAVDDAVEAVTMLGEDVVESVQDSAKDLNETLAEDAETVQNAMEGVKDAVVSPEDAADEEGKEGGKDTDQSST